MRLKAVVLRSSEECRRRGYGFLLLLKLWLWKPLTDTSLRMHFEVSIHGRAQIVVSCLSGGTDRDISGTGTQKQKTNKHMYLQND